MRRNYPSIVLVRPQLPENIGMVARAMDNCGFNKLILVSPRDKWPNKKAINTSANSKIILSKVKVFNSLKKALLSFNYIIATSNRNRFLQKPTNNIFLELFNEIPITKKVAFVFGPENSGLSNEDLRLSNYLFTINTSKKNTSLNLSHAVAIISYKIFEYFTNHKDRFSSKKNNSSELSNKKELSYFMDYLTNELEKANFFYPPSKKQGMIDNIYAIFAKAALTKKETKTLWGMLKKLRK